MIEVNGLVKDFGTIRAVDQISFSVPKGQILGFLGPNGAGKSTTMKMLTGFIYPTAGTATVGGKDIRKDSMAVRRQIGYLPENAPSYGEMTVAEFLEYVAEIRELAQPREAAYKMRDTCALKGVWHQTIETLSKGYRQRVGFAQALLHDPPVLILDEPTDGLDPNQKHEVRQLIRKMGEAKTIILSTHILEEVEAICERVIIIAQGKIVADDTCQRLMTQSELYNAVTIHGTEDVLARASKLLGALGNVARVEAGGSFVRCFSRGGKPIVNEVSQLLHAQNLPFAHLTVEKGRFDEVFRKITLKADQERSQA